ncbi:hypothetical protein A8C56_09035 [Niabella ginsenosidivorans]|uniref:TonB-dependent receptor plug domain-containing protein n=1 Tax=Niabella ginsenosidivorans TaxID=1176587 RepID=A0A1A9I3G0_9BACT|nr:hypothetical protein [Niabella ginsenosidivorans]ANH81104.1 hypothetical protein A8C56_09035 [Niabella ginsenosidivorans]
MILKKLFFLIIGIHLLHCTFSQNLEQRLNNWSQQNPIEKIYLHTDRESYTAGQTIWLKAYCMSEYIPSRRNSTIYVELLNNRSETVIRKIFPAYLGVSIGQVELPETVSSGSYQLRAYSPLMLNQPGFVFNKQIAIVGALAKNTVKNNEAAPVAIQFFPEGGNLITTLLNNVAFKATDANGYPVNITGQLKNNKGEVITSISSLHDGMGAFTLVPQAGETYFITLDGAPSKQYDLPASTGKGITFSITSTPKGKQFKIEHPAGVPEEFRAAYMIGQMQNQVIFKQPLQQGKDLIGGLIQTSNLLSGILQVTIFNKDNIPLAERLTFVDNKEYVLPGTLTVDTLNNTAHQRNRFTLNLKDTIIGDFSVSITDADYEPAPYRPLNIYACFLVNSDLRGYVHNPAYYFRSDADSVKKALDLVMMTNGWTRFKWTDVAKNTLPPVQYKDPGYIDLKGTVNIEGTRKPFANKDLLLMMRPVDTTLGKGGPSKLLQTDSSGRFRLDSIIFYDNMRILFSDVKGKKSKFIKVKMDADSLNRNYALQPLTIPFKNALSAGLQDKMTGDYNDYLKAEGITLANVTVKAREKSDKEKLEQEYTSGLFSGGINSRILDLRNEPVGAMNIFDYLQGRIPGITVSRDDQGQYVVKYRDGGFGTGKMTLYLDEMPADASMIESIPVNQIAFVKVLPGFVGAPGSGNALAIYMKKGADLNAAIEASTDIITYKGYSVIKQFYAPDYDLKTDDHPKADNRITLLWVPDIHLANISPRVPVVFYNNDRSKRFKVVIEGVTNDGRMLMIEKEIEEK